MTADCKCVNGHEFSTAVLEHDPFETNVTTTEDATCPECGTEDFEILRMESDEPDWPD